MPEVMIGFVTEAAPGRESGGKVYYDVFVAVGRRTVRTTGQDGNYTTGDVIALKGTSRLSRLGNGEIEFERQGPLCVEDLKAIPGLVLPHASSATAAKG